MEMRTCRDCGKSQPLEDYTKNGSQNGIQYYRHQCTDCYTVQKRNRRYRIIEWFEDYKRSLCCEKCGNDDFRVLEFHHNGDKEIDVSSAVRRAWSKERILKEIAKCEVLCANCHRIETWEMWKAQVIGT